MEKIKGIVEEVYIPVVDKQDVMFSKKIGFKVKTKDGIINIEEEQNEYNSLIYKNEEVIITKQKIGEKEYIDINKSGDE